jgi:hypothetical protein
MYTGKACGQANFCPEQIDHRRLKLLLFYKNNLLLLTFQAKDGQIDHLFVLLNLFI